MYNSCTSKNIGFGVFAGLLGGIFFGLMMAKVRILSTIGAIVGLSNPVAIFFTHLFISIFMGILFALFFYKKVAGRPSGVVWGLVYGISWWILGPLVLKPLSMGNTDQVLWNHPSFSDQIPSLIGHIVFGIILGYTYGWLRSRNRRLK
ncbi:MAG: hypothetical protein HYZ48_05915 [Chlamydiales bacterium]|nr:hypothetical protein [Chlamydiales bacterium]